MYIIVDNLSRKTRFRVTAILCGIALMNAAGAEAQLRLAEPVTKVVNYSDLNLNTPAGAQALYGRLRTAAVKVCAQYEGLTLKAMSQQRACVDQALALAVKRVDSTTVTAYHLGRTGKAERPVKVAAEK